jgi:hypothetical protein
VNKKAAPAGAFETQKYDLFKQDEVDAFITHQLTVGSNFAQIMSSLESAGWEHRQAYFRVAQYVAREGLKEGKTYDEVFEAMKQRGWDTEIVVAILNESMMS